MSKELIANPKDLLEEFISIKNELKDVNKKLEKSESFKSHFISNITNEIINPFTSILGISQSIMKLNEKNIGQIHSMANLIYNESFDLDFQLQNIFEAAKIEAGETDIEVNRVNIQELIADEIERFRLKAEKKGLYFSTDFQNQERQVFTTDFNKLKLIIANLISNAIKFSNEKNKILIDFKILKNQFKFSISTVGAEINKHDINKIFDRFSKLNESINSVNQGYGLGLSIVSYYIEQLNGSININSSNGMNTFSFEIMEFERNENGFQITDTDFFNEESELF